MFNNKEKLSIIFIACITIICVKYIDLLKKNIITSLSIIILIITSIILLTIYSKKKEKNNKTQQQKIKISKKTYINKNGYLQHYNPKSPDARKSGYAPVHRDVARIKIGRDIEKHEVVHHIDKNKLNNSPENLIVITKKEHYLIHRNNYKF